MADPNLIQPVAPVVSSRSSLPAPTYGDKKVQDAVPFKPQGQQDVGVIDAFLHGTPEKGDLLNEHYDPSYQPTLGESIVSAPANALRSLASSVMELNPDVIHARDSVQALAAKDPNAARQIEVSNLGGSKRLSGVENTLKGVGAAGELALTFLPMFKAGRAAMAGAETAVGLGERAGASALTEFATESGKGAAYGALYGGLYGLHEYDGDWKQAMSSAAWGAGLGGAGASFIQTLALAAKAGGGFISGAMKDVLANIKQYAAEKLPAKLYGGVFGTGAGIENIANKAGIGRGLVADIRDVSHTISSGESGLGVIQRDMIESGLQEVPNKVIFKSMTNVEKVAGKNMTLYERVGGNPALMTEGLKAYEGTGKYMNPDVREQFIKENPWMKKIEQVYSSNGDRAKQLGILGGDTGTEIVKGNYFSHKALDISTMDKTFAGTIEGGSVKNMVKNTISKTSAKLSGDTLEKALTSLPAEASNADRIAIYRKYSDPELTRTIDYQVEKGTFATPLRGYQEAYDKAALIAGKGPFGKDNKYLQGLFERSNGEFKSLADVEKTFIASMNTEGKSLTSRSSSLDFARPLNDPFYDTNIGRVTSQYAEESARRFAIAEKFGANDQKLRSIITGISKNKYLGSDAKNLANDMEHFIRVAFGTTKKSSAEGISNVLRMLETPHLAFSAVQNLAQSTNTLLASDLGSFIRGSTTAFTKENLAKQMEAGGFVSSFLKQAYQYNSGEGRAATKMLELTGFAGSEIINRTIAGNVADKMVTKHFDRLLKEFGADGEKAINSNSPSLRVLQDFGVNVQKALETGSVSKADRALAAFKFIEKTQFTGNPLDLPFWSSTPVGKIVLQFKTFAIQQTKFAAGQILSDIEERNIPRLMRNFALLGTVYPMSSNVVRDIRSLVTQEKAPDLLPKNLNDYISSVFHSGAFGVVGDMIDAIDKDRGPQFLIGSSTNDIINWLKVGNDGFRGDFKKMLKDGAKQGLSQTGIGVPIRNIFYPSTAPGESTLSKIF